MKIINTYVVMMVENAPSTLFKMLELSDGTYVKEINGYGYLEIITEEQALIYKLNMSNYLQSNKTV